MLFTLWWVGACAQPVARQEAYLWQRGWTDGVRAGVAAGRSVFSGIRVNALSIGVEGTVLHAVDLTALVGSRVRIVVRIDSNQEIEAPGTAEILATTAARWRAAGVEVVGVEIDHDCPTRALPAYAHAIREIRRQLPADLLLSVTALPTWSSSDALDEVLGAADEVVLQVHAVDSPSEGLFHEDRANRAVSAYSARTERPLWVAVPAYGMKIGERELRVDPAAVTAFVAGLDSRVAGVVWFRLPTGDPRDWALEAISGAIAGSPPTGRLELRTVAGDGVFDLSVANVGVAWTALPARLTLSGDCSAADAVGGYRMDRSAGLAWVRDDLAPLDPGAVRAVGWARCDSPPELR